jgi:hypothetical protein
MDQSAALKLAGKGGPAPVLAQCWEPASESAGAKRSAPKQGSSDRLAKRARVQSTV